MAVLKGEELWLSPEGIILQYYICNTYYCITASWDIVIDKKKRKQMVLDQDAQL